jgi:hypothetical protein
VRGNVDLTAYAGISEAISAGFARSYSLEFSPGWKSCALTSPELVTDAHSTPEFATICAIIRSNICMKSEDAFVQSASAECSFL